MSELDPQNPVNLYGIPVTSNAPVRNSPDGSNQGRDRIEVVEVPCISGVIRLDEHRARKGRVSA